jgi:hypothetical protein
MGGYLRPAGLIQRNGKFTPAARANECHPVAGKFYISLNECPGITQFEFQFQIAGISHRPAKIYA